MLMLRGAFSHLAFSARSPAKCTGPRTERDSFPFKIPYSRRVLFWLCTFRFFFFFNLHKTMQHSQPVHSLRETHLHGFLQIVSYSSWNEKCDFL